MRVTIQREEGLIEYEVQREGITLLELLTHIKTKIDNTLVFSSGCRSSVCGSCAMRVNGKEVLACSYKVADGDSIAPLNNMPIIKYLVVDMDKAYSFNKEAKAWLESNTDAKLDHNDEKTNALQSDCILCGSCYSACPVYAVNGEFLGPFSLTRVWKYVSDKREGDKSSKLERIQTSGVWDCTLCNECTLVCPQNISSKADIEKLRTESVIAGYEDPSFAQNFGGAGFVGGFGFDGSPTF